MAGSVNKVILIGHLGRDPEVRYMQDGNQVVNFTLATNESWTDRDGNKQERTEWHRVVAFRKLAEIISTYVTKGKQVYIEGKLQTRKWQGQDGQDRYTTEIVADQMVMLGSRGDTPSSGDGYQPPGSSTPPGGGGGEGGASGGPPPSTPGGDDPDDIPF